MTTEITSKQLTILACNLRKHMDVIVFGTNSNTINEALQVFSHDSELLNDAVKKFGAVSGLILVNMIYDNFTEEQRNAVWEC